MVGTTPPSPAPLICTVLSSALTNCVTPCLTFNIFSWFLQTNSLQRTVKFFYTPRWQYSDGGLKIGPNSSSPSNSKSILHLYTTPKVGYDILTEPELQYVHLLFGLKDRNVGIIESNFAPLIYAALVSLEANWPELVADIEFGRINPELAITDVVRM